ncbi:MAG: hypothetical protein JRC92_10705, partial [Deltaproteobacteria bacterium]|nr:hypothetical protein [Deltaproteobacteria bacterium]
MKKDRVLILAAGQGLKPPEADWGRLVGEFGPTAKATLLWMSDAQAGPVVETLSGAGVETDLVPAARLLKQEVGRVGQEYRLWLEALARESGGRESFWFTRLTELNFADPIWFQPVRFNVAVDLLEAGSYLGCVAVCDPVLYGMMADFCRLKDLRFAGRELDLKRSDRLRLLAYAFIGWAGDLGSELAAWRLTRRRQKVVRADWLVYARFPRNWKDGEGGRFYRYSQGVSQALAETGQKGAYLVPLARKNTRGLKDIRAIRSGREGLDSLKADLPVVVVEAYGSLGALLASYFSIKGAWPWFRWWRRASRSGLVKWRGADLGAALKREIIFTPFRDWPALRYLKRCVARALEAAEASFLLVQGFEFIEGRAVVEASRGAGAKTVGFEHGSAGRAHAWRLVIAPAVMASGGADGAGAVPELIGYESRTGANLLAAHGFPPERIRVFGAAR